MGMGNDAHRAGPSGEHRPGLARRTPERIKDAAPGELMRLFVAIAPPPAVLDHLDTAAGPFRAGRPDLRWTTREAARSTNRCLPVASIWSRTSGTAILARLLLHD